MSEPLRVTTDPEYYEAHAESLELWSPGNPLFAAPLGDEVFQVNYKEDVEDVRVRFRDWLERVIERGLALWESAL